MGGFYGHVTNKGTFQYRANASGNEPEYPLDRTEIGQLDWRVEKMALSKDKTKLRYNNFLTLCAIPPDVYEYKLGNRSAIEWIVDQYRVSRDPRSGIVNDPNRADDPEYIVRLIGQVITVSLGTVKLVRELHQTYSKLTTRNALTKSLSL
jgi:predicted helicase